MRRLGFSEGWITLIHRHISNSWYSLIVHGQRYGFFKAKNGLGQGEPISPSLFALSAKLLSIMLNKLQRRRGYKGFYMADHGPQINHLAFADDMIIFMSGHKKSIRLIMKTLATYEATSGQKINKAKSYFMVASGVPVWMKHRISRTRGNKLLSPGGKAILIRHVRLAMPTHPLSTINPPKGVFTHLEKILQKSQGCMQSFHKKIWWNLRTGGSLWGDFMKAKYFQDTHPVAVKWRKGQSLCWKELCKIREEVEENIIWILGEGQLSFWYDNWSRQRALFKMMEEEVHIVDIRLREVIEGGIWQVLGDVELPAEVESILHQQQLVVSHWVQDKVIWIATSTDSFSVALAWQQLTQKREASPIGTKVWQRMAPFKKAFVTWRALNDRLPTDTKVSKFGRNLEAKCHCGNFGKSIWDRFAGIFGVQIRGLQLRQMLLQWWSHKTWNIVTTFMVKMIPILIMWELWRSRCAVMYGSETPSRYNSERAILLELIGLTEQKFGKIRLQAFWEFFD
ncbi:uncharacterized protein LOC132047797 [Lycium ferocissimum]|uniref:uncharacterized protein LOC132047797 n=1 Tax=Lycium ferocissimum TaxID=112874 RepID=UPI0028154671|nr:uncharacterized protein LOC132047797 [Lycium ferocissimum]